MCARPTHNRVEVVVGNIYIIIVLLSYTIYIKSLKTRGELAQTTAGAVVLQDAPGQNISRRPGGV